MKKIDTGKLGAIMFKQSLIGLTVIYVLKIIAEFL